MSPLREPLLPPSDRPYPNGKFPGPLSLYSALTFAWVTPMMVTGFRRPLQEEDIFAVPREDESLSLTSRLSASFALTSPSLLKAIVKVWLPSVIASGLWKTLNDGSQFAGPIFMSMILRGLTEFSVVNLGLLALAIYLSQIIGAVGEGQYFQTGMRVGMQLRSALMALIFQKSLRLSVHSRMHGVSAGKLTNMISSDTESLQSFCEVMHVLWSAPLRIVTSMVFLYYLLGAAALAGAAVLVAMIPAQKRLVNWMTARVKRAQQFTDDRLKVVGESFEGIQLVKCYGWEEAFRSKIVNLRDRELSELYRYSLIRSVNSFIISAIPVLVAVVSFSAYSLMPGNPPLTAVQAFTALSLFQVLRFPLMQLPSVVNMLGACKVSLGRISDFLLLPETESTIPDVSDDNTGEVISMNKCDFQWPKSAAESVPFAIHVDSLDIRPGELVVVVGHTASGKSSFLQAILGLIPNTGGEFRVSKSLVETGIAYCPQTPWIFNGSVRDNITFGESVVDETRYIAALEAVQMVEDLASMPDGDRTEIGERGVNLSGGQKHRLSLARAVYSSNPLVLLDDPLSALDATVASKVYSEGIIEAMAGRTRVLVTNRLEIVLPAVGIVRPKFVVFGKEPGTVVAVGTFTELLKRQVPEFLSLVSKISSANPHGDSTESNGLVLSTKKSSVRKTSIERSSSEESVNKPAAAKLVTKEDRQTGAVSTQTVGVYVDALRYFKTIVAMYALTEITRVIASVWLSEWSSNTEQVDNPIAYYLSIYVILSFAQLGFSLVSQILGAVCGNSAARILHSKMFDHLILAPMRFFHSTPLGRILNRFSKDVGDVDKNLAAMFGMTLSVSMGLVGTLAVLAATAYYTVIGFIPVLVAFYYCQLYYRASSREIKRMDSISRSPIYAHFQQIQEGIATVTAFNKLGFVTNQNGQFIDNHIRFNLAQMSTNRWLGIRLEFYGGALVLLTALFIVSTRSVIAVGIAGLALSTALQVTGALGGIVRLSAMLENSLNSVERIHEYSCVESEIGNVGLPAPKSWPSVGSITYTNVVAYHKPPNPSDLNGPQPVLKFVSFSVRGGEKVGVIGRTGAGKTSLIMTLFRIIEVTEGSICIDGVDISKISLKQLRSALGIIPQEPIVFEGSLRDNIDPFHQYTDAEVGAAVQAAHLQSIQLDHAIVQGGKNLSAGQRQQVCLARVVLRRPKILVLDEATSSLDAVTDKLVSDTISSEFATSTVITIAHRLHTIVESDLLIALDNGRIGEIGSPQDLIGKEDGLFASLVHETGTATSKHLKERIRNSTTRKN